MAQIGFHLEVGREGERDAARILQRATKFAL